MKLVISDEDGNVVGELHTDRTRQWRDLLLYASERWEEAAGEGTRGDLETILDTRKEAYC